MTKAEALVLLREGPGINEDVSEEYGEAVDIAIEALEQEPCKDAVSRESLIDKLQREHDIYINAYGEFCNLPQNDKARVDEISHFMAMLVNEPPVTPQPKTGH